MPVKPHAPAVGVQQDDVVGFQPLHGVGDIEVDLQPWEPASQSPEIISLAVMLYIRPPYHVGKEFFPT